MPRKKKEEEIVKAVEIVNEQKEQDEKAEEVIENNSDLDFTNKILTVKDLVDIVQGYNFGIYKDSDLQKLGQSISIRSYIPMQEKISLISTIMIMHRFLPEDSNEMKIAKLYMYMFFYIMLGGYAFIDCGDSSQITYENYDILYPVFSEFIEQFCGKDLKFFDEMIHDCVSMYSVNDMQEFYDKLDPKELAKASELNKQMLGELESNKEYIKDLKDLIGYTNGDTVKIVKDLRREARDRVMKKTEIKEEK